MNVNKQNIKGIFFDLQKAFDTVDHTILLKKLHNYGIRGVMFKWLSSYLNDRKQYTVVNKVASDIGSISSGVPQGSVLGPLLFLVYVNDISQALPDEDPKLFADDTNLFLVGHDLKQLEAHANNCLSALDTWFKANKLSLNTDKTCYMCIASKSYDKAATAVNLHINVPINRVTSCKYLGVTIDETLKWDEHVSSIYNKLIKFTSIFYKVRGILPKECLKKLYYAFIYPHITFGIEVYANASTMVLDRLCKLNNKLLRTLLDKRMETPLYEMYDCLNLLPIPVLFKAKVLQFVYDCLHFRSLLPDIFHDYFTTNSTIHTHNTRQTNNLHVDSVNNTFGQRSLVYKGSKLWNELPSYLQSMPSRRGFRLELKQYLLKSIN